MRSGVLNVVKFVTGLMGAGYGLFSVGAHVQAENGLDLTDWRAIASTLFALGGSALAAWGGWGFYKQTPPLSKRVDSATATGRMDARRNLDGLAEWARDAGFWNEAKPHLTGLFDLVYRADLKSQAGAAPR